VDIHRHEKNPRAARAVVHNHTVYLAGMVADAPFLSVAQQTRQILAQMERRLESVGSSKRQLLSVTIYLSDMRRFDELNSIWDPWLDRDDPPARACVDAGMARPGFEVEMTAIAAV
jgi:enamine deaminase RidA (YjgF/YER057c/UK114 family)